MTFVRRCTRHTNALWHGQLRPVTLLTAILARKFAAVIRHRVISHPPVLPWMRRVFAAVFVALGAKLALA
jgi:threonine/homoserine/homoserine lactone efflux protein